MEDRIPLGFAVLVAFGMILLLEHCSHSTPEEREGNRGESVLTVGMEFVDAKRVIERHGARETSLAVAPPQSRNGGYMKIDCYSLSDTRALCITHDLDDGTDRIVDMEIVWDLDKPKNRRESEKRTEIDIGSR